MEYLCGKHEIDMRTREELSALIEDYIRDIVFPVEPETLYSPIMYSLESGGKRVRPLLTLMAANIFSDTPEAALPCGVALEVFHNFTLLHDDIMDNASVRRGKPSVHRKWGSNVAILSGDAMMIYSYKILEQAPAALLPRLLKIFNAISLQVCEGQQYDMNFEGLEDVSITEYLEMIRLKTAVLMSGGCLMGAMCGGASEEDCALLERFGTDLGLAFQIQDDILDNYGSEEILGKKIGGDIMEGKKTFLTISAMNAADEHTRIRLAGLLHNREMIREEKIGQVLEIFEKLGTRQVAEKAVAFYTGQAIDALDSLGISPGRTEQIRELAYELTKRIN